MKNHTYLPMKMEQTECSETSVYKIQTTGNDPEESLQQDSRKSGKERPLASVALITIGTEMTR